MELYALQQELPNLIAANAALVAITPELPDHTMSTVEKHHLSFEILSDVNHHVARRFGLVFQLPENLHAFFGSARIDLPKTQGNANFELPIPATFVMDRNGKVVKAHVDVDYTTRLEPSEVVSAVQQLQAAERHKGN